MSQNDGYINTRPARIRIGFVMACSLILNTTLSRSGDAQGWDVKVLQDVIAQQTAVMGKLLESMKHQNEELGKSGSKDLDSETARKLDLAEKARRLTLEEAMEDLNRDIESLNHEVDATESKAQVPPRIYLMVKDSRDIDTSAKVRASLESIVVQGQHVIVPRIVGRPDSTTRNELRFFRSADKEEADMIKVEISKKLPRIQNLAIRDYSGKYEKSPAFRPRHYELWLGTS